MEELEDELQQVEDAKVRLEVSMQALRQQLDRERAEREESVEEGRKGLMRQARQLEVCACRGFACHTNPECAWCLSER